MPHRRVIKARDLIADIRAGLGKSALREKYRLSEKGFEKVCTQLVAAGAIAAYEVPQMPSLHCSLIKGEAVRVHDRYYLDFNLPIYEQGKPDLVGGVRDITLEGVGVRGLEATEGDRKVLVIPRLEFGGYQPFSFVGVCRWSRKASLRSENFSGFKITRISEADLEQLGRLIGMVSSGE